jgi:hypothetical protein
MNNTHTCMCVCGCVCSEIAEINSKNGAKGILKGTGKVRPRTNYDGPEGQQRCRSALSLTSAIDGGGCLRPRPGRFIPVKEPRYPLYRGAVWAPGRVWAETGNLTPTGVRSPDRPARRQSIYRPSYKIRDTIFLSFSLSRYIHWL